MRSQKFRTIVFSIGSHTDVETEVVMENSASGVWCFGFGVREDRPELLGGHVGVCAGADLREASCSGWLH